VPQYEKINEMSVKVKTGRKIKLVCSCGHNKWTNVCGKVNATKIVYGSKMWTKRPESDTAIVTSRSISISIDIIEQVTSETM
jgi:hypothetical protein